MNSYDQALYEGEAPGNLGFTSILPGNGKWFLRQVFNGRGWHQPDGNYHARCWLNIYGFDEGAGFRFDDGGCEFDRPGCGDSNAYNYRPDATVDALAAELPEADVEPRERVAQLAPRELGDVGQDVARQVCQGDRALVGASIGFFALFRCHI